MPTITKHGNGWRVQWREGGRGSKIRRGPTMASKAEATAEGQRISARIAARGPTRALIPWQELIERYLIKRKDKTPAHLLTVRKTLERISVQRGWENVCACTPESVSNLTLLQARMVRALLRYAMDYLDQPVDRRAIVAAKPETPRRKPRTLLADADVAALQAAADHWHLADGLMIHLISTYGHRCETLISATWSDWSERGLRLRVKSGDTIEHPLTSATTARLMALRNAIKPASGDPLIVGHLERPWESGQEAAAWMGHSLRGADGQRAGILDLRGYAITRMLDLTNGDARLVAGVTGHRTPSLLLNVYARTNQRRVSGLIGSMDRPKAGAPPLEDGPVTTAAHGGKAGRNMARHATTAIDSWDKLDSQKDYDDAAVES